MVGGGRVVAAAMGVKVVAMMVGVGVREAAAEAVVVVAEVVVAAEVVVGAVVLAGAEVVVKVVVRSSSS